MYNVLKVSFCKKTNIETKPLYQYDYGQVIKFIDIELPRACEVHFSNYAHGKSTTQVVTSNEVSIPDAYLQTGLDVYVWLYFHEGSNDGETEYMLHIPVIRRAKLTDEVPTQEEASAISQAIAALNSGVTRAENEADAAEASAAAASNSEVAAGSYAENARAAASAANEKAAETRADAATAVAESAKAIDAANTAIDAATRAQKSADDANIDAENAAVAQVATEAARDEAQEAQEAAERAMNMSVQKAAESAESAESAADSASAAGQSAQRAEEAAASIDKSMITGIVTDYLDEHPITVTEEDPTVPSWAKQPAKPSYTAQEVGAVPVEAGKGLSTNDYTAVEKEKLADIEAGAQVNVQSDWNQSDSSADDFIKNKPSIPAAVTVDSSLSDTSENPIQNKVVKAAVDTKYSKPLTGIPASDLAAGVIPTIPTKISDLIDDSDFINIQEAATAAPVQSVNNKTGAVTLTASDVGALSAEALSDMIDDALAEAKESGLFDNNPPLVDATPAQVYYSTTSATPITGTLEDFPPDADITDAKISVTLDGVTYTAPRVEYDDKVYYGNFNGEDYPFLLLYRSTWFAAIGISARSIKIAGEALCTPTEAFKSALNNSGIEITVDSFTAGYNDDEGATVVNTTAENIIEKINAGHTVFFSYKDRQGVFTDVYCVVGFEDNDGMGSFTSASLKDSSQSITWNYDSYNSNPYTIDVANNPAPGAFLMWNGSAWVAQTLATWQGGNY